METPLKIILKGKPRSTNNIYRATCRGKFASVYLSKEGKDLKEDYQWQAKAQYRGRPHINALGIKMKIYHPTHRKNDIDNFNKLAFDSLTGIVWEDDDQIEELHIKKHYDKDSPRIELIIKRI